MSSVNYATKYVAFVDILGFKSLVERADADTHLQSEVFNALRSVHSRKSPKGGSTGLQAQNFSDSLILSADKTVEGLWHLLLSLDALAWNLLSAGVLVRGAVALGGIHHDDDTVFGVGVNEAYRLESTVAKFPRIILSRTVLEAANHYADDDQSSWGGYRERLLRADDGVWHLNYLYDLADEAGKASPDQSWLVAGCGIRDNLQHKLDEIVDQPDVYGKLAWLAKFWNRALVAAPPDWQLRLAGQA